MRTALSAAVEKNEISEKKGDERQLKDWTVYPITLKVGRRDVHLPALPRLTVTSWSPSALLLWSKYSFSKGHRLAPLKLMDLKSNPSSCTATSFLSFLALPFRGGHSHSPASIKPSPLQPSLMTDSIHPVHSQRKKSTLQSSLPQNLIP